MSKVLPPSYFGMFGKDIRIRWFSGGEADLVGNSLHFASLS